MACVGVSHAIPKSEACPECGATIEGIVAGNDTEASDDVSTVRGHSSGHGDTSSAVAAVACAACETIIGTEGHGVGVDRVGTASTADRRLV